MKKKCLSILLYHRVLNEYDPLRPSEPNVRYFDQQMKWVKRFFNVLDLADAVKKLKTNSLPSRALCITFDDGYKDNHQNAMPILEKYGLTATFFIATGFLNNGIMWNDTVIECIRNTKQKELDLNEYGLSNFNIQSNQAGLINEILHELKYLSFEDRAKVVFDLPGILNVEKPYGLMMTEDEVINLRERSMGIGGHTVNHPILSKIESDYANRELKEGKLMLEEIINERISLFAYPNGKPGKDYEQEHVDMMKQVGFDAAVSTAWGVASGESDPYQLPRFTPWDKNIAKYLVRLGKMRYSKTEMKA